MSIVEVTTSSQALAEGAIPVEAIDLTDSAGRAARVTFTITDAAAACAVSRKTVTRKLAELALHGAAKDDDGIWRIPVEALLAVGLHPGRSLPEPGSRAPVVASATPTRPTTPTQAAGSDMVTVPRERWDDLRIRLARAEAEASERALALADARLALRALTAGPTGQSPASGPTGNAPASGPRTADPREESGSAAAAPVVPEPSSTSSGSGSAPSAMSPAGGQAGMSSANSTPASGADPVAAARAFAAQNGGHVPAVPAPPARKRRWWQSH